MQVQEEEKDKEKDREKEKEKRLLLTRFGQNSEHSRDQLKIYRLPIE